MKQQNSLVQLEESESLSNLKDQTPSPGQQATVVLKKGQIISLKTQALANSQSIAGNQQDGVRPALEINSQQQMTLQLQQKEQSPSKVGARKNSRNTMKNSVNITNINKSDFVFSPVGGPEIASSTSNSIVEHATTGGSQQRTQIPSGLKNANEALKQQIHRIQKNPILSTSIDVSQGSTTHNFVNSGNISIRNGQNGGNSNGALNNIKVNGSVRNLQNLRSKRVEKIYQNQNNESQQQQQLRAPPIQNGLYFSNIIQNNTNQSNQRYQQQAVLHQPGKNNQQIHHSKVQSLDMSNIFKNIVVGNVGGGQQSPHQMPAISTINSPKNVAISLNNSIEKINKNINESIQNRVGGNAKEFQLIQAYQQQKWKEQLTQRKNKPQGIKSLDLTSDNNGSFIQSLTKDQFQSAKNSMFAQQSIQFPQQQQKIVPVNQQRSRVIGGGSLSSRLQQEAMTQDSSTFSSTIDDELRGSKAQIKFPLSTQEAFKILQPYLWEYEKQEILEYDTIYFFNMTERKKQNSQQRQSGQPQLMGTADAGNMNYGFDTDQQEYAVIMHEHLAYRYEIVKKLGKGSFGIVLRVFDHKTKDFLALKILKNKKRLYKQGLVEAKLLDTLNKSDPEDKKNIIRKLEHFVFRKHLMITFEMLSINLYEFIKMNNFQGFSLNLIKRFAIQILIGLFFMKEHNIVHCDMKPENILLRKINKSGIKIIDFGSGCFEHEKIYTYIQSRFYRAPEIVLGITYTPAIDMWSYGCILYELYVGYPLFPGEDEKEHMAMIMEVKGVPPRSVLARATRRKVFFDEDYQALIVPNSRGKVRVPGTKSIACLMNCPDKDFVDFIDKCIEWKVENRLTPEQAFSHPFIAKAVHELKGMRGQSETQKQNQLNIQGQAKQQASIISNSETMLPHINQKQ